MERVVTINLAGNPCQLEEPAYDALRSYMGRAEGALADNPDKAEVIRDLEQAIADKCNGCLSPGKTVVSAAEMANVLEEMGPVEGGGDSDGEQPGEESAARPQRRLYRIYDRSAWTGVSAGLAAYAGIDVAWVRTLWILSALFTGGFTILVYLILIFAMPVASTSEELAAAHGAPFNAQEVIDRAKREYDRFANEGAGAGWRAQMRAQRRAWKAQRRAARAHWRSWEHNAAPMAAPPSPAGYLTRVLAGVAAFVLSIVTAALLIAFLLAFFSLLGNGAVLGWTPPSDVPMWLVLVVLAIAYAAISSPFSALRRASYATVSGHSHGGAGDSAVVLILVVSGFLAWMYVPEARAIMEQAYLILRDALTHVRNELN
jgi:phage shock protein PspC (stress-responsive transcriptional regulator)